MPLVVVVDGRAAGIECLMRIDPRSGGRGRPDRPGPALQRTTASTEAATCWPGTSSTTSATAATSGSATAWTRRRGPPATRLGFTYEGRFRQALVYKERNRDTDWFSITDAEWPAVRAGFEAWLDPANHGPDGQRARLEDLRLRRTAPDRRTHHGGCRAAPPTARSRCR